MIFESPEILVEFQAGPADGFASDLIRLLVWVDNLHWKLFNKPACVTNLTGDFGKGNQHSKGFAADLATWGADGKIWYPRDEYPKHVKTPYLTEQQEKRLTDEINRKWNLQTFFPSGAEMMPAVAHVGTGPHIHLQVSRVRPMVLRDL